MNGIIRTKLPVVLSSSHTLKLWPRQISSILVSEAGATILTTPRNEEDQTKPGSETTAFTSKGPWQLEAVHGAA